MSSLKQKIRLLSFGVLILSIRTSLLKENIKECLEKTKGMAHWLTVAENEEGLDNLFTETFNDMLPVGIKIENYREIFELLINKKIFDSEVISQKEVNKKLSQIEDNMFKILTSLLPNNDTELKREIEDLLKFVKISIISRLFTESTQTSLEPVYFFANHFSLKNFLENMNNQCQNKKTSGKINSVQMKSCQEKIESMKKFLVEKEQKIRTAFADNFFLLRQPKSAFLCVIEILIGQNEMQKQIITDRENWVTLRIKHLISFWLANPEEVSKGLILANWMLYDLRDIDQKYAVEIFGKESKKKGMDSAQKFFTQILGQIFAFVSKQNEISEAFNIALNYFDFFFSQSTKHKETFKAHYDRNYKNLFKQKLSQTEFYPGNKVEIGENTPEKFAIVSILNNIDEASDVTEEDQKAFISNFVYLTDLTCDQRRALQQLQDNIGEEEQLQFSGDLHLFEVAQNNFFNFMVFGKNVYKNESDIYKKFLEFPKQEYTIDLKDAKEIEEAFNINRNFLRNGHRLSGLNIGALSEENRVMLFHFFTLEERLKDFSYFSNFALEQKQKQLLIFKGKRIGLNEDENETNGLEIDKIEEDIKALEALKEIKNPQVDDLYEVVSKFLETISNGYDFPVIGRNLI